MGKHNYLKTPKCVCYGSSDPLPGYQQQSPKPCRKNLVGLGRVSVTQHKHEYLIYVDKEEGWPGKMPREMGLLAHKLESQTKMCYKNKLELIQLSVELNSLFKCHKASTEELFNIFQ